MTYSYLNQYTYIQEYETAFVPQTIAYNIKKNKKYKKKYIKYTEIKRIEILYLHYYTELLL